MEQLLQVLAIAVSEGAEGAELEVPAHLARTLDSNGNCLLHIAVGDARTATNDALIAQLIKHNPTAVEVRNSIGATPLSNCVSFAAASMLLQCSPECIQVKDAYDRLPLHTICSNPKISHEVGEKIVEMLVLAYPDGCRARTKNLSLPLHFAIAASRTANTIKILLDAFDGAAALTNRYISSPPAKAKSPLEIVERMTSAPLEGSRQHLPIHQALEAPKPCWQTVLLLAHAFPAAVGFAPHCGALPLVVAIRGGAPPWLVQCFLEFHPAGVLARVASDGEDNGFDSPLTLAIRNPSNAASEDAELIVRLIVKKFPLGIFDRAGDSVSFPIDLTVHEGSWSLAACILMAYIDIVAQCPTPADVQALPVFSSLDLTVELLRMHAPTELVFLALKAFPKTVREVREQTLQLPLHKAVSCVCSLEVVSLLLELNSAAASTMDYYGKLPVHYAAERSEEGVMGSLLRVLPSSAAAPDGTGKTPLVIAFAFRPSACVYEEILRHAPAVASTKLPSGRLPIMEAIHERLGDDVIYAILCNSMPLLRGTMTPNASYKGQFHSIISWQEGSDEKEVAGVDKSKECAGEEAATDAVTEKSQLYTRLVEKILDEFTLTHILSHCKHPKTGQTILEVSAPYFRGLLLERMFLFSRYKLKQDDRIGAASHSPRKAKQLGRVSPMKAYTRPGSFVCAHLCLDIKGLSSPPVVVALLCFEEYTRFLVVSAALEARNKLIRTHTLEAEQHHFQRQMLESLLGESQALVHFIIAVDCDTPESLTKLIEEINDNGTGGGGDELREPTTATS